MTSIYWDFSFNIEQMSIQTMTMSKFSKLSAALPLSVYENPPPLFLLFLRWRSWTSLMVLTRKILSGSIWSSSWIQTTKPPSTPDRLLSSRMDSQRIGSSGWCASVRLRTFWQDQDVLDFLEGSSLILFWTSSHEEVGGRRLRCPWQWNPRTSA
jgi:hypothetical protein